MAVWALVHVQFPGTENSIREIESNVENSGWLRIQSDPRNLSSTWKKSYTGDKDGLLIKNIPSDFLKASMDYDIFPLLIIHLGPKEPQLKIFGGPFILKQTDGNEYSLE